MPSLPIRNRARQPPPSLPAPTTARSSNHTDRPIRSAKRRCSPSLLDPNLSPRSCKQHRDSRRRQPQRVANELIGLTEISVAENKTFSGCEPAVFGKLGIILVSEIVALAISLEMLDE